MFTTAWWSARTHARTRASLCLRGCACECVRVVRMDMQRVAVCWCAAAQRELRAGQAPSSMRLSDSAALSAFTCVSCSPCSSTRMHKKLQIWPIAGLARGWIQTTKIVRCMLEVHLNLPRPRNLPKRRLSSRAEGRQKPKSAPDDAPVWWRWPVPGTSDTINVHL